VVGGKIAREQEGKGERGKPRATQPVTKLHASTRERGREGGKIAREQEGRG